MCELFLLLPYVGLQNILHFIRFEENEPLIVIYRYLDPRRPIIEKYKWMDDKVVFCS